MNAAGTVGDDEGGIGGERVGHVAGMGAIDDGRDGTWGRFVLMVDLAARIDLGSACLPVAGVPHGIPVYARCWMPVAAGPHDFTASNAVVAVTVESSPRGKDCR